jgi:hypothetical protein
MKRIGRLLGVALLAMGLIRLTAVLWGRSAGFVADTWRNELERAPDDRVDAILARIATLGDDAIPVLADALGSDRDVVAQVARRTLWAQIDAWDAAPRRDLGARYHRLAAALAARMGRYGPAARQDAAHMVTHLLSQPLSRPLPDAGGRSKLLAACTQVLRGQQGIPGAPKKGDSPLFWAQSSPTALAIATAPANSREGSVSLTLPGLASGLPLETAPYPEAEGKTASTVEARASGRSEEPRPLQGISPDRGADSLRCPSRLSSRPDKLDRADRDPSAPTANEPKRLVPVLRLIHEEADASGKGPADGPRTTGDVRAVAKRLHDEDPARVEEARKELKRRGFMERELDLASQSTDPDPAVRRKLARTLLSTPGVDAGPWLLELCGDEDADVRLEAITLLATTGDPALIEQVRRRAQLDPDERIQRLAERLARPTGSRENKK